MPNLPNQKEIKFYYNNKKKKNRRPSNTYKYFRYSFYSIKNFIIKKICKNVKYCFFLISGDKKKLQTPK